MARKLPWASTSESPAKRARISTVMPSPPSPRISKADKFDERSVQIKMSISAVAEKGKQRSSRTPSTSPPPGPPTAGLMLDGYDGDDIYMMVEDEFQSVAQTFTAHLHHAEYKRLKKQAKTRKPEELPESALPMMTEESKKRLQRGILQSKQKQVLSNITFRHGEDEEADSTAEQDDPWRGTSLSGLMRNSHEQKTSLVGLEKMKSSTRAAQGFTRTESEDENGIKAIFDQHSAPSKKRIFTKFDLDQSRISNGPSRVQTSRTEKDNNSTILKKSTVTSSVPDQHAKQATSSLIRSKTVLAKKRQKTTEEKKEDRLSTVPMFLM